LTAFIKAPPVRAVPDRRAWPSQDPLALARPRCRAIFDALHRCCARTLLPSVGPVQVFRHPSSNFCSRQRKSSVDRAGPALSPTPHGRARPRHSSGSATPTTTTNHRVARADPPLIPCNPRTRAGTPLGARPRQRRRAGYLSNSFPMRRPAIQSPTAASAAR
jgi:hypothetical protein